MSQRAVEGLLGRIITDQSFRRRFYTDPTAACMAEAMEVTSRELEAVLTLDEKQVAGFAQQLDSRIVRASISGEVPSTKADAEAGCEADSRPKQLRGR